MYSELFLLLSVLSIFGSSNALSDAQAKVEFMKIVMKCLKDHPVGTSELMALQAFKVPTKMETKCLLACAYKAEGSLTEKGILDREHGYQRAKELAEGDQKRLENGKKVADICAKVNEEKVSDGDKGCDRAALVFKCLVETAPKYGFKI